MTFRQAVTEICFKTEKVTFDLWRSRSLIKVKKISIRSGSYRDTYTCKVSKPSDRQFPGNFRLLDELKNVNFDLWRSRSWVKVAEISICTASYGDTYTCKVSKPSD